MVTQSIWQLFNSHADHEPLSLSSTKWWTTTIHSSAQELIRVVILPNCDCRTEPNVLFVITIRDNNIISQHLRHFARPEQLRESQSWTRQTRSRSTSIKDKGHYVTPLELLHISYSSSNINGLKGDLCCSVVQEVEDSLVDVPRQNTATAEQVYYNNVLNTRH